MKFMTINPIYYHGQYLDASPQAPLFFAVPDDEVPSPTWRACDEQAQKALERYKGQEQHGIRVNLDIVPPPPNVLRLGNFERPPEPLKINYMEPSTLSEAASGKRPSDQEPARRR